MIHFGKRRTFRNSQLLHFKIAFKKNEKLCTFPLCMREFYFSSFMFSAPESFLVFWNGFNIIDPQNPSQTKHKIDLFFHVKYILSKSELEIPGERKRAFPPEHVWHFAKTEPFSMKIFLGRILHILTDQKFFWRHTHKWRKV